MISGEISFVYEKAGKTTEISSILHLTGKTPLIFISGLFFINLFSIHALHGLIQAK